MPTLPVLVRSGVLAALLAGVFLLGRYSAQPAADASAQPGPATAPRAKAPESSPTDGRSTPATAEHSSTSLATLIARVRSAPTCLADEEARQRAIAEWAERDPAAAIAFAQTELRGDQRAQATATILARWGAKDPAAAWAWVETNQPDARHHFDTLLEAFGKNSPQLAARYAAAFAETHPGTAAEMHLAALLGVTHTGDFTAARALVDANPKLTPEERGVLLNFIAGQWARFQPEAAAAWVQALPAGAVRDQATIGLGESWSDRDPAGAASFAANLPAGDLRQVALRQAILKWALEDSTKASEWVTTNKPHPDFDQAIAAMVTYHEFLERHLDLALRWTDTIYDGGLREEAVTQIIGNWYAHNPAEALAYLNTAAKLPPEKRETLRRQLVPGS